MTLITRRNRCWHRTAAGHGLAMKSFSAWNLRRIWG